MVTYTSTITLFFHNLKSEEQMQVLEIYYIQYKLFLKHSDVNENTRINVIIVFFCKMFIFKKAIIRQYMQMSFFAFQKFKMRQDILKHGASAMYW